MPSDESIPPMHPDDALLASHAPSALSSASRKADSSVAAASVGSGSGSSSGSSLVGELSPDLKADSPPAPQARERITRDELVVVLSRYDLGPINAVEDFPHGSRRSPKVVVHAVQGEYLVKRRRRVAAEVLEPETKRVRYIHDIRRLLQEKGFPVAKMVGTRDGKGTLLKLGADLYELAEFVTGEPWGQTEAEARTGGQRLSQIHQLLRGIEPGKRASSGSYHRSEKVDQAFTRAAQVVPTLYRDCNGDLFAATLGFLRGMYRRAGEEAETLGLSRWPLQLIHGDWQPEILAFQPGHDCRAVLDLDTLRLGQRALDLGAGAQRFASTRAAGVGLDIANYHAFFTGYDGVQGNEASVAEVKAVPWLMIEHLIAETVMALASKGRQSGVRGDKAAETLRARVEWIRGHHDALIEALM